jgi:hypothetical protein
MANPQNTVLRAGDEIQRKFKRKIFRLSVIKDGDVLKYKVSDKTFTSLSAAAKYVIGSNMQINGPAFWSRSIVKS